MESKVDISRRRALRALGAGAASTAFFQHMQSACAPNNAGTSDGEDAAGGGAADLQVVASGSNEAPAAAPAPASISGPSAAPHSHRVVLTPTKA